MFFNSGIFWFLMGILFVLIVAGFRVFARDRGWSVTWWKALLGILWYGLLMLTFYAWGTLIGENEGAAGFRILILGLFLCLVSGICLWRWIAAKKQA
jgi:hypothetical protein